MTPTLSTAAHPALDRLRAATGAAHRRLDAMLDVVEALSCSRRRPELVRRYRRFHAGAAILLRPWAAAEHRSWLAAHDPGGVVVPEWRRFAPGCAAEALGLRYVIEGSALGGRVILRTLEARGVQTAELGFLDPLGDAAGATWRGFLCLLERSLATAPARDAAVRGAENGFAFAERELCGAQNGDRVTSGMERVA
ncbi:MAG: biliverdin-producing heme oxygenase [Gluconacetobacter diazotrophicus]|nr:biliverdin-producing heme oxygenase [Gluconacetobacter diazotrophicus]